MVFEIEREIGSFYRGWDEDGLDDEDLQLPPPFDDDEMDDPETEGNGISALGHSSMPPLTASPAAADFPPDGAPRESPHRDRHYSMPASAAQGSPVATSFPPRQVPAGRPRRNSSIHEPSPLARLFIKSGFDSDVIDRLRERRQSLVGLAMPSSQSQPALASGLQPQARGRAHSRTLSQRPQVLKPLQPLQPSNLARTQPPVQPSPILEDDSRNSTLKARAPREDRVAKKLAFASPNITPTPSRPSSPAPGRTRPGGMPFPRRDPSTSGASMSGGTIGKASEVEARQSDLGTTGRTDEERNWKDQLEGMEERQMRIEDMLKRLVGDI